jgi:hypothetical protein
MRLVVFLIIVLVTVTLVLPALRRRPRRGSAPSSTLDELVKDPVCRTYVVRSRAVRRADATGVRYFCSAECARRDTASR